MNSESAAANFNRCLNSDTVAADNNRYMNSDSAAVYANMNKFPSNNNNIPNDITNILDEG